MCHISQFYACSQVNTGSELYYICELGKYLKAEKGEILSLKGVILPETLEKSDFWSYFAYAYQNNYVKDIDSNRKLPTSITVDDLKRIHKENVAKTGVFFEVQTPQQWVWQLESEKATSEQRIENLKSINTMYRSQALVSLVAYVAVMRFIHGCPEKFVLNLSYEITNYPMAIVDLMMLKLYSTSITWCTINTEVDAKVKYETWLYFHRDRGYIRHEYSLGEKTKALQDFDVQVGDIIFVYNRDKNQKQTFSKSIVSARTGVIREIGSNYITISMYNLVSTRFGKKKFLSELENTNKNLFVGKKIFDVYENKEKIHLLDIGINYIMHTENLFLISDISSSNIDDSVQLWVSDGTREDIVELDAVNAIYWLLKDNEIPFDEKRYLEKYSKDGSLDYDKYMSGGVPTDGKII